MELTAKFQNNICSVYNTDNEKIGEIIYIKNNRKDCEFKFENKAIIIQSDKWNSKIIEDSEIIYNLKIDKLWGNIDFQNSENKIKGISGISGGTKMVDKNDETIITIKNTTHLLKKNHYIIKSKNTNLTYIFICLYSHILGSKMKSMGVVSNI